MRSSRAAAAAALAGAIAVAACGGRTDPSSESATADPSVEGPAQGEAAGRRATPMAVPAFAIDTRAIAAPAQGACGDFKSCEVDADCVAVPRAGCCQLGWMEAVNRNYAEAYAASCDTCTTEDPMCIAMRVIDTRVPQCEVLSDPIAIARSCQECPVAAPKHACAMVPVGDIRCGGFVRNPHACPGDYHCKLPPVPDVAGRCERSGEK